jgi:sulfur carrier protein ThiS adenylyltransferase
MIPNKNEMIAAYEARHGKELQKKLSATTVAVCGLGGLGSNISIALSRAGIGKLILIDFDKVDISNLHRRQYKANQIGLPKTEALSSNLSEIAPYTVVETHCVKITEENAVDLLSGADMICEAFDNPQAKAMLANTVLEKLPGKFYVGATGMAGIGSTNETKTRRLSK